MYMLRSSRSNGLPETQSRALAAVTEKLRVEQDRMVLAGMALSLLGQLAIVAADGGITRMGEPTHDPSFGRQGAQLDILHLPNGSILEVRTIRTQTKQSTQTKLDYGHFIDKDGTPVFQPEIAIQTNIGNDRSVSVYLYTEVAAISGPTDIGGKHEGGISRDTIHTLGDALLVRAVTPPVSGHE